MTHLSPTGGSVSPPPAWLSRQVLDQQIARRRARLIALEAEMIAACEGRGLGRTSRHQGDCGMRALGSDDMAPLPRRSHAAGGDIRPAHTSSPTGDRPARTADDAAVCCPIWTTKRFALRAVPCAFGATRLAAIIHGNLGRVRRPLPAAHERRGRGRNASPVLHHRGNETATDTLPWCVTPPERRHLRGVDWGPRQRPVPWMPRTVSRSCR